MIRPNFAGRGAGYISDAADLSLQKLYICGPAKGRKKQKIAKWHA